MYKLKRDNQGRFTTVSQDLKTAKERVNKILALSLFNITIWYIIMFAVIDLV